MWNHTCPICDKDVPFSLLSHIQDYHRLQLEYEVKHPTLPFMEFRCPCGYIKEINSPLSVASYDHLLQKCEKHRLILMMAARK